MSARLAALARFEADWRALLAQAGRVEFFCAPLPDDGQTAVAKANAFVAQQGFTPIGFNWEMLDASGGVDAARSAMGTMIEALSRDLVQPNREWLEPDAAQECARAFLAAFDPARATILTNHLNGLWWPISQARDEWTFVGMDDAVIALLLLAR